MLDCLLRGFGIYGTHDSEYSLHMSAYMRFQAWLTLSDSTSLDVPVITTAVRTAVHRKQPDPGPIGSAIAISDCHPERLMDPNLA